MAMFSRGRQLIWEQRYDEARAALAELLTFVDAHEEAEPYRIEAEVDSAASYIEEGSALDSADKPAEAKACLMKAVEAFTALVEKYPDDAGWTPFMKFEIGFAYVVAGDTANAKTAFLQLAADYPDNCWSWAAFDYVDLGIERPERPATFRVKEGE